MKSFWNPKQSTDKKDMNWAQARWNFPGLRPNNDYDRDGIRNQFDCKPFDRKRQHDTEDQIQHESKWKTRITQRFKTIGDLKRYAKDRGFRED